MTNNLEKHQMNLMRKLANTTIVGMTLLLITFAILSPLQADEGIPYSIVNLGSGPFYSNHVIVVDKSSRAVSVWEQDSSSQYKKVREYFADFGKMTGDKVAQGDHKTPEGIYEFTGYLENARLNFQEYGSHEVKAFPMNYPNLFDKRDGKTGAGIWLHAIPENTPLTRGSRGCVVLKKDDIEDVGHFIKLQNTPIIVNDTVKYLSAKEVHGQKEAVVTYLKKWLESWQTKNFSQYMGFYANDFRSRGMNYSAWQDYKQGLAAQRAEIFVTISEPRIIRHKDEWVVQFFQKYKSEVFEDFGHKTLYLKGDINNLKIIAEEFDLTKNQTALAQFDFRNFSCCENRSLSHTQTAN